MRHGYGCVYFLRPVDGGPVKIGFTRGALSARLAAIQANSPLILEVVGSREAPYWHELALHRMLAAHRLHGEWFAECMEVLVLVDDFIAGATPNGVLLDAMDLERDAA